MDGRMSKTKGLLQNLWKHGFICKNNDVYSLKGKKKQSEHPQISLQSGRGVNWFHMGHVEAPFLQTSIEGKKNIISKINECVEESINKHINKENVIDFLDFVKAIVWWHTESMLPVTRIHLPLMESKSKQREWRPIAMSVTLRKVSLRKIIQQWASAEVIIVYNIEKK